MTCHRRFLTQNFCRYSAMQAVYVLDFYTLAIRGLDDRISVFQEDAIQAAARVFVHLYTSHTVMAKSSPGSGFGFTATTMQTMSRGGGSLIRNSKFWCLVL
jgi:hypothetical protein